MSGARFLDSERGIPLGLGTGEFSESQVHLSEGSRLVFYSDGITEATNGTDEEYGASVCGTMFCNQRLLPKAFWRTCAPSPTARACTMTPQ